MAEKPIAQLLKSVNTGIAIMGSIKTIGELHAWYILQVLIEPAICLKERVPMALPDVLVGPVTRGFYVSLRETNRRQYYTVSYGGWIFKLLEIEINGATILGAGFPAA